MSMPKFRFETIDSDRTTISEEELASADLASPRAIEKAHAVLLAHRSVDQTASITKVYDEAGYLVATVNFSDVMRDESRRQPISDPFPEEPGVIRSG
jgi:hypothetical protein